MGRLFTSRMRKPLPAATRAWALPVLVLLALVFVFLAVVFAFVVLPRLLYGEAPCSQPPDPKRPCTGLTAADRATAQNGVRAAGVTALLALGGAGTALAAYRTYRVNQQGHVTGRYKDAVAQLGNDQLAVRLGGIYALERLMKDSSGDQPTILEVLAAYIRQSPADSRSPEPRPRPEDARPDDGVAQDLSPCEDIQASLTVIGRRTKRSDERPIALSGAHLEGADLAKAQLEDADLTGAQLKKANLSGAQLRGANLTGAQLESANLSGAQLRDANLTGAQLRDAKLPSARLDGANLTRAQLRGANLTGAQLETANLSSAQLGYGTDLTGARLKKANLSDAQLSGAVLLNVDLGGADLSDANLGGVQRLSQKRLNAARGNTNTILPEGHIRPAAWST